MHIWSGNSKKIPEKSVKNAQVATSVLLQLRTSIGLFQCINAASMLFLFEESQKYTQKLEFARWRSVWMRLTWSPDILQERRWQLGRNKFELPDMNEQY